MTTVTTDILARITAYDTIIIHRHQRPDPDAYGSQLGLKALLQASFPTKAIYAVGKAIPGLQWVAADHTQPMMDTVPHGTYQNALVIVVDTANAPRIDDQQWSRAKEVIKIDHHPNEDHYADWEWVDDTASATSTLIFRFYQQFADQLCMTPTVARYLYIGIIGDTGRFMYSNDAETFKTVGELFAWPFDYAKVHHNMTTISENAVKFSGYVMQNIAISPAGFASVILTRDTIDQFDLGDEGTAFVVPIPARIARVKAWAIFEEQSTGEYRVRLRSRTVPINQIASAFGGGGHAMASGAWAQDATEISEISERVEHALEKWSANATTEDM